MIDKNLKGLVTVMQRLYSELIFSEFYSSYRTVRNSMIPIKDLTHNYFVLNDQLYLFLITGIMMFPLSKDLQYIMVHPGRIEPLSPAHVRNLARHNRLSLRSQKQLINFAERIDYRLQTISKEVLEEIKNHMDSLALNHSSADVRNLGIYFWQYSDETEELEEYDFW